jgi:ferritin-like metal-binding protein YciE
MSAEGEEKMAAKSLDTLFHEILKDVYYTERKLLRALPRMADGANCSDLAALFERRRAQTEEQVRRLAKVFATLGKLPQERTWPVIDGMIDEGPEIVEHYQLSPALDAGLIAAAQTVAHYEITRYGALKRWATMLGMSEAAQLLDETLQEELQAGAELSALADRALIAELRSKTLLFEAVTPPARYPEAA